MSKFVLNSLAMSEFIFMILLLVYSSPLFTGKDSKYHFNTYGLFILSGLFVKQIPEKISKMVGQQMLNKCDKRGNESCGIWEFWRRPKNAMNCGLLDPMLDKDIPAKGTGMPSGHSTVISFLVSILVLNLIEIKRETQMDVNMMTIAFMLVLLILIPASRVDAGCHTITQVIMGVLLGFVIGLGYYVVEKRVLRENPTFAEDRASFYRLLVQ